MNMVTDTLSAKGTCNNFLFKYRAICFLHVALPRSLQIEITILCLLSLKALERQKYFSSDISIH